MTAPTPVTPGGRMPRLHVTVPQDLYDEMRSHDWSPSELIREAIRERLREEEREAERERHLEYLLATFGEPTPEEEARAKADVDRWLGRSSDPEPAP